MIFADRRDGDWNLVPGFLPMLAAWFPADAFLSTSGDRPFARLLASESRLGQALSVAWRNMQLEVGLDVSGPLRQAAASAGVGDDKLQRALTEQREQARFSAARCCCSSAPCRRHPADYMAELG